MAIYENLFWNKKNRAIKLYTEYRLMIDSSLPGQTNLEIKSFSCGHDRKKKKIIIFDLALS